MSATFLLVSFLNLKDSNCETRKNVFRFTWKAFFVLEKIKILTIQISWRHQMPKHKTRNILYWITCDVNTVLKTSSRHFCIYKKKIHPKKFLIFQEMVLSSLISFLNFRKEISDLEKKTAWKKFLIFSQKMLFFYFGKHNCLMFS